MDFKAFKAFKEKVQSDGAFAAQFKGKKPSEVVDIAKAAGYTITTDDLKASLSDEDLENIAGGAFVTGGHFIKDDPID